MFFVAVCAYTWLEEGTAQYGWPPRAAAIIMSAGLIFNACICFIVGARVGGEGEDKEDERVEGERVGAREGTLVEEPGQEPEEYTPEQLRTDADAGFETELDERNRWARRALPRGFFGIHEWSSGDAGGESFPSTYRNANTVTRRLGHKHERSLTMDEGGQKADSGAVEPPARAKVRRQTQG